MAFQIHQELTDGTYNTAAVCEVDDKRRALLTAKAIAKTYGPDADVARIFVIEWSAKVVATFKTAAAR